MAQEDQEPSVVAPSTGSTQAPIVEYDFKNPRRIQPQQQETLKIIHDTYAQHLSTTLSSFLRSEVKVALQSAEQQTFAEYVRSLHAPTCVGIFDMQQLTGYGLLEVNSILIYAIVDRLMGGTGKVNKVERSFTQLELSIARRLLQLLLKDLSLAWDYLIQVSFELKDIQTNPVFVRITPEREICVSIALKVQIGDIAGLITLCLPYSNLESIAAKLDNQQSPYTLSQSVEVKHKLQQSLGSIDLDVVAVLGAIQLSMEDLLSLQVGDVLNLGLKARNPIILRVAGESKFKAIPGLIGKFRGVTIEQEITKE